MSEVSAIAVPASLQTLFFLKMGSKGAAIATVIYGNMGTLAYAAITILAPIQLLTVSMAAGLASSSGILIAKSIGDKKYDEAYCTGSIYTFHQARCSPAIGETSLCCRS